MSCLVTPFHNLPSWTPLLDKMTVLFKMADTFKMADVIYGAIHDGTQRPEPLSDDFLFSMSSSTENRLSYASSPESDLEVSPPPAPRLVKSSSDPSIATTQDNMDRDDDLNHLVDAVPPPYTVCIFVDISLFIFSITLT